MKKFLLVCLLIFILAFSCISCSTKKEDSPLDPNHPTIVTVWHYYNGNQQVLFDNLVREFNATIGSEKGIIVEAISMSSIQNTEENILASSKEMINSKKMPDMFLAYPDTIIEIDKLGKIAALDKYFTQEELNEYLPDFINDNKINGKIKSIPIAKSTEILMLNKMQWNKFSQTMNVKEDDLKTWESLAKTSKLYYEYTDSLTPEPNDGKAFFGRDAIANYLFVGSAQLGEEIIKVDKENNASLNFNKSTMRTLWDNYYIPYICGYYYENGRFRSDDAKTGDLIALVCSTAGSIYFPSKVISSGDKTYTTEALVLELPNFENSKPYAIKQGADLAITKNDESHEYACVEFAKWLSSVEQDFSYTVSGGYFPVKKEILNNSSISINLSAQKNNIDNIDILNKIIPVSLQTLSESKLYSVKPFHNSTSVRDILEASFTEKYLKDRELFKQKLNSGIPFETVLAEFNTDKNFNDWYEETRKKLSDALKENKGDK